MTGKERLAHILWSGLFIVIGVVIVLAVMIVAASLTFYEVMNNTAKTAYALSLVALAVLMPFALLWVNRRLTGSFDGLGGRKKKRKGKPKYD